ncbi:group I intron endonuclease, partial [Bifidobacterium apri]
MYVVYKHTTPSGKVYIGITGKKPEYRWKNGNGYKDNAHFDNAIKKYGWENTKHEIVANGLTKEQACDLEIELIAKYHATDPRKGYNISAGGESRGGGGKHARAAGGGRRGGGGHAGVQRGAGYAAARGGSAGGRERLHQGGLGGGWRAVRGARRHS